MKIEFYGQVFEKYSVIKFHENSSIGSGFFLKNGQICRHDDAKVVFRNFPNSPKYKSVSSREIISVLILFIPFK
jgi:hypothetical protein